MNNTLNQTQFKSGTPKAFAHVLTLPLNQPKMLSRKIKAPTVEDLPMQSHRCKACVTATPALSKRICK